MGIIYCIMHMDSGTSYIGSTIQDARKRWGQHLGALRWGKHGNPYLQAAWNKYGKASFQFIILEEVTNNQLIKREQYWLDKYRIVGSVYNIGESVECPWRGRKHSEETRAKMRGRTVSEETRHRLSIAGMGHPVSMTTRRKIAEAGKKRVWAEDVRAKLRVARAGRIPYIKSYPAFYNERTNEKIPLGQNLVQLCRERGLNHGNMWMVAHGKRRSCQGWILAPDNLGG